MTDNSFCIKVRKDVISILEKLEIFQEDAFSPKDHYAESVKEVAREGTHWDIIQEVWKTHSLQQRYNSMLIVVDFKNYQEPLSPSTLYVPTKYLNKQTGTFGIIFTREDLNEAAQKEQLRLVSTEEKVLLSFSDNDLIAMLEEKKAGGSVTYRVNDKYFSLIKKI